jgi:nuclear GTP-binding protein
VTRGVQEVVLDKSIRLLDSPGIIFSADEDAAAAALRNAVKASSRPTPFVCARAFPGAASRHSLPAP